MLELMNVYGRQNVPFLFVLDFELKQPVVLPLQAAAKAGIWFDIAGHSNMVRRTQLPTDIWFEGLPMSEVHYQAAFDEVQWHLRQGNSFLTNLTFPTPVMSNLSLRQIFEHSVARYKLLFQDQFVVFSPEPFIKISEGKIASYPMKGTIDARLFNAEECLRNDPKEQAEHATIVDLIRNDLSRVAHNVQVERFQYLDRIQALDRELLQMSSKITGELPKDYQSHLGDLFLELLPAGSISGAPKVKTLEIIKSAEGYNRGYYTGVFGYYANGYLESSVMIRFVEQQGDQLVYKSGGGITVYSEAVREYQELIDKVYVPINRDHSAPKWASSSPFVAPATP